MGDYSIQLVDLTRDAFIKLSKHSITSVKLSSIITYGGKVVEILRNKGISAKLSLSKEETDNMLYNTNLFFNFSEDEHGVTVHLKDNIIINDLRKISRESVPFDVLVAMLDSTATNALLNSIKIK